MKNEKNEREIKDFLQMYLINGGSPLNKIFTPEIIVEEFILSMAGFMSVSTLIADFLTQLNTYPELLPKLLEEQKNIIDEFGNSITPKILEKSKYLSGTLKETLRFQSYLISWRYCYKDVIFHDGLVVPENSYVVVAQSSFHFDDEKYPESNQFKPERWNREVPQEEQEEPSSNTADQKKTETKISNYLAFGTARHTCPGRHWVYLCAEFVLTLYLRHFSFETSPNGLLISSKNSETN